MAEQINTQFIKAPTKDKFCEKLSANEIKNSSIVFIEDTQEIWTQGHYYPCPCTKDELETKLRWIETSCTNGKSIIFNRNNDDGGGVKFEHTDNSTSFVGVNNGGQNGMSAQMYARKNGNKSTGVAIRLTTARATYCKNGENEDQNCREILVKEDLDNAESEIKKEINTKYTELDEKIGQTETDLKGQIGTVKSELESKIEETKEDLENEIQNVKSEITGKINGLGDVYNIKGSKDNFSDLKSLPSVKKGDVYNVKNAVTIGDQKYAPGTNFVYTGDTPNQAGTESNWDSLGGTFDLSGVESKIDAANSKIDQTKKDLEDEIGQKEAELNGKIGAVSDKVDDLEQNFETQMQEHESKVDQQIQETKKELENKINQQNTDFNGKITVIEEKIETEIGEAKEEFENQMQQHETEVSKQIEQHKTEITQQITQITKQIEEQGSTAEGKYNQALKDVNLKFTGSADDNSFHGQLQTTGTKLGGGTVSHSTDINIPVASSSSAGIISSADYNKIDTATNDISSVKSQAIKEITPQYTDASSTSACQGNLQIGTTLVNGSPGTQKQVTITIPNATNSKAGAITGSDKSKYDGYNSTIQDIQKNALKEVKTTVQNTTDDTSGYHGVLQTNCKTINDSTSSSNADILIPLASSSSAGLIRKSDYTKWNGYDSKISSSQSDISTIKGQALKDVTNTITENIDNSAGYYGVVTVKGTQINGGTTTHTMDIKVPVATTSKAGLLTSIDKQKYDNYDSRITSIQGSIETGGISKVSGSIVNNTDDAAGYHGIVTLKNELITGEEYNNTFDIKVPLASSSQAGVIKSTDYSKWNSYESSISSIQGNYVKKSGDTMTGSLTCQSKITATGFYESSDINFKDNVKIIDEDDIKKVNEVQLKQFNFKNDSTTKYGVIAQEVEKAGLNNLVSEIDGHKTVDYISLLILKIQALENRVKELESYGKMFNC